MTYLPDGYVEVTPYLTVVDAKRLLQLIVTVFDGQLIRRVEEADGTIKHASVKIGNSHIELSEASEQWHPTPAALHIYVEDADATHTKAIENGCEVVLEPEDMAYGERSSVVKDPFGNSWYIATFQKTTG